MFVRFLSLIGLLVSILPFIASAQPAFAPHASGDRFTRYPQTEGTFPYASRPGYLIPVSIETGAGATTWNAVLTRVTGDSAASIMHLNSSMWGGDGRHQYSSRSSWNANGTLIYIENGTCNDCDAMWKAPFCPKTSNPDPNNPADFNGYNGPAAPNKLFLDGDTYIPQNVGQFAAITAGVVKELVWHPSPSWADYMIVVRDSSDEQLDRSLLQWVNVRTGSVARTWTLPFRVTGIGPGEGAPSNDGRFIALLNAAGTSVVVVDMNPQPPLDSYPSRRISGVFALPQPCGLTCNINCPVGHVSVSSLGTYLDVAYGNDFHRVFDIDWKLSQQAATPTVVGPHAMGVAPPGCFDGSVALGTDGWIMPLKHADHLTYGGEEYLVGFDNCRLTGACPGAGSLHPAAKDSGRVVLVNLNDGASRHISAGYLDAQPPETGTREQSGAHVSARNLSGQTAWVFATYEKPASAEASGDSRMMGETVAWSLNTPKAVKRFTWSHSAWSGADQGFACYRAEMHPSPSPDGRRILFASNWRRWTQGVRDYPPDTWRKAYVIDTRPTPAAITGLSGESTEGCAVTLRWTAPKDDMLDPGSGSVAAYEIRYSTTPDITVENFYDQESLAPPTPVTPGSPQTLVVSGLSDLQTYYFAVRSIGTYGPRSVISGPVAATPGPPPPHDPPFFCP